MPFKVEVTGELVETTRPRKDGSGSWTARNQRAVVFLPGMKYPVSFVLSLRDRQEPYALGVYVMAADSFYVNGYGDLRISPRLVKVEAVKAA